MEATMADMRALLTAQTSKDPRQQLHRVRALAFGHNEPTPAPAPKPADDPKPKRGIFSKKKDDDE